VFIGHYASSRWGLSPRPGSEPKAAFTAPCFRVLSAAVDRLKARATDADTLFFLDRVRVAVSTLLTCVLRSSKLVDNPSHAAASSCRAEVLMRWRWPATPMARYPEVLLTPCRGCRQGRERVVLSGGKEQGEELNGAKE
jgi:hypothetical protein